MDTEKPPNSTAGLPRQTGRSIPRKRAPKQRIQDSERLLISWFGSDIAFMELISDETFRRWLARLDELCLARGWIIERRGNPIDLIFGCLARSITRREFFQFQRDWDALNQEFGFRFSGALYLMTATNKHDGDLPFEIYVAGTKRHGDSIGKPSRRRRKSVKPTTPPKEPAPLRLAEGMEGRLLRAAMPKRTVKEMIEQADTLRKAAEPELERLRRDKSWERNHPRDGLQVQIAVEELMEDKSWDRSAPKDWLQERAVHRERQREEGRSGKEQR